MGTILKRLDPAFRRASYGYTNLTALIRAFPEVFATRTLACKGHPILLRRTTSDSS